MKGIWSNYYNGDRHRRWQLCCSQDGDGKHHLNFCIQSLTNVSFWSCYPILAAKAKTSWWIKKRIFNHRCMWKRLDPGVRLNVQYVKISHGQVVLPPLSIPSFFHYTALHSCWMAFRKKNFLSLKGPFSLTTYPYLPRISNILKRLGVRIRQLWGTESRNSPIGRFSCRLRLKLSHRSRNFSTLISVMG